jgi:hypothetical protein
MAGGDGLDTDILAIGTLSLLDVAEALGHAQARLGRNESTRDAA